jgi:dUTP pyrophosphatase
MKFARTDRRAKKPTRKHPTDAGLDLYTVKREIINPHEMKIIDTGVAIELPEGTMGLIKPKSRHTLLVGAGVVDQDYRGEIRVRVYNTGARNLYFEKHDPIAQLVVVPILTPEIELVPFDELQKTKRGKSGGINESV